MKAHQNVDNNRRRATYRKFRPHTPGWRGNWIAVRLNKNKKEQLYMDGILKFEYLNGNGTDILNKSGKGQFWTRSNLQTIYP